MKTRSRCVRRSKRTVNGLTQSPTSTSTEFVLDTNVAIEFMSAPAAASSRIGPDAALCVPITVFGELFRGAQKSSRVAGNIRRVENFSSGVKILTHDMETAR